MAPVKYGLLAKELPTNPFLSFLFDEATVRPFLSIRKQSDISKLVLMRSSRLFARSRSVEVPESRAATIASAGPSDFAAFVTSSRLS